MGPGGRIQCECGLVKRNIVAKIVDSKRSAKRMQPRIKQVHEDFFVRENLMIPMPRNGERFTYLTLTKAGYTTFEAVRVISDFLGVDRRSVSYAGLKDEDGITEQLLALEGPILDGRILAFNEAYGSGPRRAVLTRSGTGDHAIHIGQLQGNSFCITVRGLDGEREATLRQSLPGSQYFLNYYDVQRFGVPGGPRTTHLIGRALLAGKHRRALQILVTACTPESEAAAAHVGTPEEFFQKCDPRMVSFYCSSAASFDWNAALADQVAKVVSDTCEQMCDGLLYRYCAHKEDALKVLSSAAMIPYTKYRDNGLGIVAKPGSRTSVIQVRMSLLGTGPDDMNRGASKALLAFTLPSGCYATMCLKQLVDPDINAQHA